MEAKRFSEAMNELDVRYIEEAASYRPQKKGLLHRNRRLSVVLLAAGLTVILVGCVAVVAGVFGTRLIDVFTSETVDGTDFRQSGYDLAVDIERIPMSGLSEEVRLAGETIQQQFIDYDLFSSRFPGNLQTEFSSRKDACAYIGFKGLDQPDLGMDEQETTVSITGDEEGKVLSLEIETGYADGDIRAQLFSHLYTENYIEEITTGVRTTESVEYKESFMTNRDGRTCQVIESTAMESGYKCLDGYLVDNGIMHNLHIIYKEKDTEQAKNLLHHWAEK